MATGLGASEQWVVAVGVPAASGGVAGGVAG